ncbi:RHS repeat-associated core domain-containing protein [Corallococcus exercitus]|uniref:RHS repeat-associated core domain-containing protein n=1 Tax=Corallococcus exercitus TaxID=2316736 RepID=UPI001315146A|nr:RHS repeat-associated core domain-containing protein [Corallococcus exercitus]
MSAPRVNLKDFTTRFTAADVGIHGDQGGLNFVRKYVSTDNFCSYQSMLGNSVEPFVAKPFGSSPTRQSSMRWWHTLYSFVHVQGSVPGVSTWAVRDTEGEVIEFAACQITGSGCYATLRTNSRWSNASLFWAINGTFILTKPGEGRFIYGHRWTATAGGLVRRFFLSQIQEDRLTGTPRVRLTLAYATPPPFNQGGQMVNCPGASALGNGVPFLSAVTTEEGSRLRLSYRAINTAPGVTPGAECVLDKLYLRNNANSSDATETAVAVYHYALTTGVSVERPGLLAGVDYPETGDSVAYEDTTATTATSTAWRISVNQSALTGHTYQSGKVASVSTGTTTSMAMSAGGGDCDGPAAMGGGPTCVPPSVEPTAATSGDSAGTSVQYRRRFFTRSTAYAPYAILDGIQDTCVSGNCMSFAAGDISYGYATPADGTLYRSSVRNKLGRYDTQQMTFAPAGTGSVPGTANPVTQVSRGYGQDYYGNGGVAGVTTNDVFASFPAGAIPSPWKPVEFSTDTIPSVLQPNGQVVTRTTYDTSTRFVKSVIRSGFTQTFNDGTGTWSSPVARHVGIFYYNHLKCDGEADTGGTVLKEVRGPCLVSGPEATGCTGSDYPITQYRYYGPPSVERSNNAGRLWKVSRYTYHQGASNTCAWSPLTTEYQDYDARGVATKIITPQGGVMTMTYQGGRLVSALHDTVSTTLRYDGAHLRAVYASPKAVWDVYCYRTGTAAGVGCQGGQKTDKLQWMAVANDEYGVDWSEKSVRTYWPSGALKTEERRARRGGVEELRTQSTHHPDPHLRPTYNRQGAGTGSFAAVNNFDLNNNLIATGRPFNAAPDFCRNPDTTLSALCTQMGYDSADRLNRVSEYLPGAVEQHSTIAYDAQGNVNTVRTGCASAVAGCGLLASYQYDDFGNLIHTQLPHATGPVRQAFDARGNLLVKQTEAMRLSNEWLEYSYDILSRPRNATRRSSGTTPVSETLYQFGYDAEAAVPSGCGSSVMYSAGRLLYRDDSLGRTWYRYDVLGRVRSELRQRQGDAGCTPELETRYTYDYLGRLREILYPYGRTVTYVYGTFANAHRVSAVDVTLFTNSGPETRRLLSKVAWEPFGGLRGYEINPLPAQSAPVAVEYALGDDGTQPPSNCSAAFPSASNSDLTGRLRSLRVSQNDYNPGSPFNIGDIYKRTYTWNADQVVRTDTCLLGATTPRTELYAYDRTLRLMSASRPTGNWEATGGAFAQQTFGYDRRGNRSQFTQFDSAYAYSLAYDTGARPDLLMSVVPPSGQYKETNFTYDADGRAVTKEMGHYTSGQPANLMEFRYAPFNATEGQGAARESVFRAVRVNGMTYNYFYDALGRRRAKVNPFNRRDEFFHGTGNQLLVDQGWNEVVPFQGSFRVVDDYIWLGGRPVMLIRGRLDATQNVREPDSTVDCRRDGEPAACGVYFPVTDSVGKPVLMLNGDGLVAGAADYQPFGHVNRLSTPDSSTIPYPDDDGETFTGFIQAAENSNVQVRARARFMFIDIHDGQDDVLVLTNDPSNPEEVAYQDSEMNQVITPWLSLPANGMSVHIGAGPADSTGPNTSAGAAMESFEYQRYQTGAQPFWTPLRFAGHYYDAETDLFENWNRYYDPSVGRYLQPEPMLGQAPSALPAYAYALNNPMAYVDPNGNEPFGLSPVPYLAGFLRQHYGRNVYNQTVPYSSLAANKWEPLSDAKSMYHRFGPGNEKNEKWVSPDGKCEAVYKDGELVTDPLNYGTYNYSSPNGIDGLGHFVYDVVPYWLYGNTPQFPDPTPIWARILGPKFY